MHLNRDSTGNLRRTIGKYDLAERLGRGATASVYRALDTFSKTDVAIKIFDASLFADSAAPEVACFQREQSLLGQFHHPHVISTLDASQEGDVRFVVMEYVDGVTLAKYCAPGKPVDIDVCLDMVFKLVRALRYVHAKGIVHRDVKPQNAMVDRRGEVKLCDFGTAVLLSSGEQMDLAGSPAYMAPELYDNRPADMQTDIFSLGILFYQLLTGALPFTGESPFTLLFQMLHEQPPAPSSRRPGIPDAIDSIVLKAMAPARAIRYQTWDELSEDLSAASFEFGGIKFRREALQHSSGKFEMLKRSSFFADLDEIELWEMVDCGVFRHVIIDDELFAEGELGVCFLVVLAGRAAIRKAGKDIDWIEADTSVGEVSYVLRNAVRRNASVVALEEGLVLRVSHDDMQLLSVSCRGKIEQNFLRLLAVRLIDVNKKLAKAMV